MLYGLDTAASTHLSSDSLSKLTASLQCKCVSGPQELEKEECEDCQGEEEPHIRCNDCTIKER